MLRRAQYALSWRGDPPSQARGGMRRFGMAW